MWSNEQLKVVSLNNYKQDLLEAENRLKYDDGLTNAQRSKLEDDVNFLEGVISELQMEIDYDSNF